MLTRLRTQTAALRAATVAAAVASDTAVRRPMRPHHPGAASDSEEGSSDEWVDTEECSACSASEAEEAEEAEDGEEEEEEDGEGCETDLDRILMDRVDNMENMPIVSSELFKAYARRIAELEPDLESALQDPTISERKKIKMAELQLLALSSDPITYEYIELRNLVSAYIKSTRFKAALKGDKGGNKSSTNPRGLAARVSALPPGVPTAAADEVRARAAELFKLDKSDGEYGKLLAWLDTALTLLESCGRTATGVDQPRGGGGGGIRDMLASARDKMEKRMYGIPHIKTQVLIFLHAQYSKGAAPVLGLVGPPGVGKTSLAQMIAEALGKELTVIPAAGLRDVNILTGHSYTYMGAQPGSIANAVIRKGPAHVMLIDEIDKASESVQHALLHLLDPQQNRHFVDAFFGNSIGIDLSRMVFVVSANSAAELPRPLIDRMLMCELSDYTSTEKARILCEYVAPQHNVRITEDVAAQLMLVVGACEGVRPYAQALQSVADLNRLERVMTDADGDESGAAAAATTLELTPDMVCKYAHRQTAMRAQASHTNMTMYM